MKFVGLDGLSHFWTKAKSWIIDRITTEVTAKIAEIVANAPEDLDTLKEIADWISSHADDAAAMNTAILANTEAISGKADKSHTHTKSEITDFPTSLPANGGTATTATNLKVSNHDANNTAYYPIWANGKGDGSTARGTYTSTDLNYIPATGNFKSKQFTVGGGVSLQWNSTTKSLDFIFA